MTMSPSHASSLASGSDWLAGPAPHSSAGWVWKSDIRSAAERDPEALLSLKEPRVYPKRIIPMGGDSR